MSFSKQYPPHQSSINRPQTHVSDHFIALLHPAHSSSLQRQQPQLQGLLRHSDQSYPNSPQQVTLISNKGEILVCGIQH